MQRTRGCCLRCGEFVVIEVGEARSGRLIENDGEARSCEYPDCSLTAVREEMVQFASGEWYCPDHGLLAAVELVSLYSGAGIADWGSISRILGETLPEIVTKSARQRAGRVGS